MSENYPEPCAECGSDGWSEEMGGSQLLWHKRSCSRWHWYCDGGPLNEPKPFDHPFNSRAEAELARSSPVTPL
jgi:hypothetical protein